MNKELLINRVIAILNDSGFIISDRCDIRPRSFDLAARRDTLFLLIKVLYNIDGLNQETAGEMTFLSKHLKGSPVVIGEKTRDHSIETGVAYFRYGIPAIDIDTFSDYLLQKAPPLIYAEHGGLYVNIDGSIMKEERIKKNISLGALASLLGVSRRTISKYEEGEMAASVDVAIKLEEILNKGFAVAVDLFERNDPGYVSKNINRTHEDSDGTRENLLNILSFLKDMGFDVLPTTQAPFDAVSISSDRRDENATILTGVGDFTSTTVKKAYLMSSISRVANTESLLIIHGQSKIKNIDRTVLVEDKEVKKFNDKDDFIDLIQQRRHKIEVA